MTTTALHKRRVIYMSDAEWQAALDYADSVGLTASAVVRNAVGGLIYGRSVLPAPSYSNVSTAMAQAERDAILRRVNRKGSGA